MAISRDMHKKAPSQNPVDFYQCKQNGQLQGGNPRPAKVPDALKSGKLREEVMGRKDLSRQ